VLFLDREFQLDHDGFLCQGLKTGSILSARLEKI
jgi:hypothetical protein